MAHNGLNEAKVIKNDEFYISLSFNMFNYYLNGSYEYKIRYKLGGIM